MIVTVGALKGGCGKTSTSFSLAIMEANRGRSVLVCDSDTNENLYSLSLIREQAIGDAGFGVVQYTGRDIKRQLLRQRDKWDTIIIDAGKEGCDTASLKSALSISDVLLTPFTPRPLDIMLLRETEEQHIQEAIEDFGNTKLKCYSFISKADSSGGSENRETEAFLRGEEPQYYEFIGTVFERKPVVKAQSGGLAITEYKDNSQKSSIDKGVFELMNLHSRVFNLEQEVARSIKNPAPLKNCEQPKEIN